MYSPAGIAEPLPGLFYQLRVRINANLRTWRRRFSGKHLSKDGNGYGLAPWFITENNIEPVGLSGGRVIVNGKRYIAAVG